MPPITTYSTMSTPISLEAQTILNSLREKGYWESAGGAVQVQWLPDEGRGIIDVRNIEGVEGRKGYYKILRSVLPKLDVLAELPAEWQFNPDAGQKGRIYQMLGPKLKGNLTPNPDMPNNALTWNTKPTTNPGKILDIQKPKPERRVNQRTPDSNGLLDPVHFPEEIAERGYPKTIEEMIERGLNVVEDEDGIVRKMKYRARAKEQFFNGKGYKFEPTDYTKLKVGKRAHHQKVKGRGIDEPLSSIERLMTGNVEKQIATLNSFAPYGGIELEHFEAVSKGGPRQRPYNIRPASYDLNNWKSNLPRDIPTIPFGVETVEEMNQLGYEIIDGKWKANQTLDEMFAKAARFKEVKNTKLMREIGRPLSGDVKAVRTPARVVDPGTAKQQLLFRNPKPATDADTGVRNLFKDVDVTGKPLTNAQTTEALESIAIKNNVPLEDVSSLGKAMRRAGSILPFVGAGLDAWDVQQRWEEAMNNPNEGLADWMDKVQLGLATTTLGTSFWAEPANFALGMANLGIDVARIAFEEDKREDFNSTMRAIGRGGAHIANRLF